MTETQIELPAGLPRLGDLDESSTNAKHVADADVLLGEWAPPIMSNCSLHNSRRNRIKST